MAHFQKSFSIGLFITIVAFAANGAVGDTINGTVVDSISNAAIDSVTVSSEGLSAKTNSSGIFNLILSSAGAIEARQTLPGPHFAWDPAHNAFRWSGFSGEFSIRVYDLTGRVASQFTNQKDAGDGRFSVAGVPQGIYMAVITAQGRSASYKIVSLHGGTGNSFGAIARMSGAGLTMLAKELATARSHAVTFAKTGYKTIVMTVPAATAASPGIKVKMATQAANVPWDWNGDVGTGQSLAVGQGGSPVKATTQPYHNLKLSTGNLPWQIDPANSALSMVPLIEPIGRMASNYPSSWPTNISGETYHSCMGNEITALVQAATGKDFIGVQGEFGENGQCMTYLKKNAVQSGVNGRAYAATLIEVTAIARLAKAAGKTYGVGAISILHGECDAGNANYESDLHQLWSDYNTDIPAITGQTQKIQMLVSQQNSTNDRAASTLAQWKVGIHYPNDIVCIGPKYQYPSVDGTHLTTDGYEPLGEKFGEVYYQRIIMGNNWQPLAPDTATRSGSVITVRFHVPVMPLVWETTFPAAHPTIAEWKNGKGFEVRTASGRVTINSVAISGDSVQITCASTLAAGTFVEYALTAEPTRMSTPFAGLTRWGQLRDSDPFVGTITKKAQPNYCVAFELTVQ